MIEAKIPDYITKTGGKFSFNGWPPDDTPLATFDRNDWLACLHGCMFCVQFGCPEEAAEYLADDGLLHELVHLASGIDICTHSLMANLRSEVEYLQQLVEGLLEATKISR